MEVINYIGRAIGYYREQKGWSTVQLANESGLSQGSISLYENGRRNPSEDALGKISNAFGITINTLKERADDFAKKSQANDAVIERKNVGQDYEYERSRQIDRIYRFNDYVVPLNSDIFISINARVHDLVEMVEYSNRPGGLSSRHSVSYRRDRSSLIAHLTEKVFHDFLEDYMDEISVRFEDELKRINMDGYQLIEEMRNKYK